MPTKTKHAAKKTKKATAAKKKSSVKRKKKVSLVSASEAQRFWSTDGTILSNLLDLEAALGKMSDDVFTHHVTKDKNDFADWVLYVLNDHELSKALRRSKKLSTARTVVIRRLKLYDI